MPSLNSSSQKKNRILIFLLVAAVLLLILSPVVKFGISGVFFSIDPDVVYVANALSYIQSKQIHYFDHPGTLAIVLLSYSYIPFRLFAKLFSTSGFIDWVFNNYDFVLYYSRLFQSLLLGASLYIYLTSVQKLSKGMFSVIFSLLGLLVYSSFYYLGILISAETTSFLLAAVWLFFLVKFIETKEPKKLYILAFLSGMAFGIRATNAFVVPASLLLVLASKETPLKEKTKITIKNIGLVLIGFLIAIWPIKDKAVIILKRLVFFAGTTEIHGAGERKIFDLSSYLSSSISLLTREHVAFVIVVFSLVASLAAVYKKRDLISRSLFIISVTIFLGILTFAKFPLAYYQLINYVIMVFVASYYFSKTHTIIKTIVIALLIIASISKVDTYHTTVTKVATKTSIFNEYQATNLARKANVWYWARSRDYSLIWSRWWGRMFIENIAKQRPDLLELETGFDEIELPSGELVPVFDACWDQLYILDTTAIEFTNKYPNRGLTKMTIPGTEMALIKSSHCSATKL